MVRNTFELNPVAPFDLKLTVWALRRRAHNIVDRWDGGTYRRVLPLPSGPVGVAVTQLASPASARLQVTVTGQPVVDAVRTDVTAALNRLLGLQVDLTDFYQSAMHDRRLWTLAQHFQGVKPPRFTTVFESTVNAMACQQLTLTVGVHLLNRLAVAFGVKHADGGEIVHAFPRPADLARRKLTELRPLGFSRQKSRAIINLAISVEEGHLDLEELVTLVDDEAVARLCELRGAGRWTAEYVLLRGMGRIHVFPGDDVGARNSLQSWLQQTKSLDYEGVRRVLSRWNPYAGLIYFHLLLDRLWQAGQIPK